MPLLENSCGLDLKFQSKWDFCRAGAAKGMSDNQPNKPPASINKTVTFESSDRRDAITQPAVPAPTVNQIDALHIWIKKI